MVSMDENCPFSESYKQASHFFFLKGDNLMVEINDDEVRENLLEVSKGIQAVGRMVGSKKKDIDLDSLASTLKIYANVLKTYSKMLKD